MKFKSLNVFCGSNRGLNPCFAEVAEELAHKMCAEGTQMVYGGASVGIMGLLADTMLEQNGKIVGVITQPLVDVELAHRGIDTLHIVKTMAERKDLMAELSDSFLLFPGGAGSLDEFFEVMTWAQLGYHDKPCAILNVNGYYDDILKFIDKAVMENFIRAEHRDMLVIANTVDELFEKLEAFEPTASIKWVDK